MLPCLVVVDEDSTEHEGGSEQTRQNDDHNPFHSSLASRLLLHLLVPVDGKVDLVLLLPGVNIRVLGAVGSAVLLGDDHVTASPELFLGSTTNLPSPIFTGAPIVGRNVPPLENALGTGQILWQLVLCFKDSVARSWKVTRTNSVALLQKIPVKAGLGGRFCRVVVWAETELKVTHVVRCQLYPDLDGLPLSVFSCDHSTTISASSFICSRLWFVPSIPTNATFASVGLPLASEASAVAFVVVVVRRSVKPVPPHSGPTRRFDQPAVPKGVAHQQGKQGHHQLHPHLDGATM